MFGNKCLHDWETKDKTLTEVPFERIKSTEGASMKGSGSWFFNQTYILVLACKKCGALDKTIKEITP